MSIGGFIICSAFPYRLAVLALGLWVAAGCQSESQKKLESLRRFPTLEKATLFLADADPSVRLLATATVDARITPSPEAVDALVKALSDSDSVVRVAAAAALKRTGVHGKKALPFLLDRLADRVEGVRLISIESLGFLSRGDTAVVQALIRTVIDIEETHKIRVEAVIALARQSEYAPGPIALFAQSLGKKLGRIDPSMAAAAIFLSFHTSGAPDRLAGFFLKRLSSATPLARRMAARFLAFSGPAGSHAFPALLRALEDPDETVRARVAEAIGVLRHDPEKAIPALLKLLGAENIMFIDTTLYTARALVAFGPAVVPHLLKKLESLTSSDRFWAVVILGEIGSQARPAAPAIRRLIRSPFEDKPILEAAALSLKRITRRRR